MKGFGYHFWKYGFSDHGYFLLLFCFIISQKFVNFSSTAYPQNASELEFQREAVCGKHCGFANDYGSGMCECVCAGFRKLSKA